jgi:hypothetical protein
MLSSDELAAPCVLAVEVYSECIESLIKEHGEFIAPTHDIAQRLGLQAVQSDELEHIAKATQGQRAV